MNRPTSIRWQIRELFISNTSRSVSSFPILSLSNPSGKDCCCYRVILLFNTFLYPWAASLYFQQSERRWPLFRHRSDYQSLACRRAVASFLFWTHRRFGFLFSDGHIQNPTPTKKFLERLNNDGPFPFVKNPPPTLNLLDLTSCESTLDLSRNYYRSPNSR